MKSLVQFLNESVKAESQVLSKKKVYDWLEREVAKLYGSKSGKVSAEEMDDICANYDNQPVGSLAGIATFDFGNEYPCFGGVKASSDVNVGEDNLEYMLKRVYSGSEKYFIDVVNIKKNIAIQCFSGYIKVIDNGNFSNPRKYEYGKINSSALNSVSVLADCVTPVFDKTGVDQKYYKLLEDKDTYIFVGERD